MKSLPSPTDDPTDVYRTCVGGVRDDELRGRLEAVEEDITAAADVYAHAAANQALHTIPTTLSVADVVDAHEMAAVYRGRMARRGSPGRPVYDKLLSAPAHGRCPLCGQRTVATLDHYLPKLLYPALTVNPVNLVPACSDCNKTKGEFAPNSASTQILHPYFDNVEGQTWLHGEVVEGTPPTVRFEVIAPLEWPEEIGARILHHFQLLGLGKLYGSYASEELVNVRYALSKLFEDAGADSVREHLETQATSYAATRRNSWQAATYRALADSEWYVSGGFGLVDRAAIEAALAEPVAT